MRLRDEWGTRRVVRNAGGPRHQRFGVSLGDDGGIRGCGGFEEEGPAAGGGACGAAGCGFGSGCLAARIHQGAELVEAVGGGEAGGGELPEGVGGLLAGEAGEALEVGGEAGAALGEDGAEAEGFGRESGGEEGLVDGVRREGVGEPVGGLAQVEGDGRGVGGDDAAGTRRKPSPTDGEDQAGCGEMRPQPTAPERQSWSSQAGE